MAKLRIPERHQKGLSELLALPDSAFKALTAALNAQTPGVRLISQISAAISLSNVDIDKGSLEDIASAIVSLHLVRASDDKELNEFVEDVIEAIAFLKIQLDTQVETARQRLRAVLDVDPLVRSAKAYVVLTDHQRTLHSAKVFTDIRYAFQLDAEREPYGAVIVHTLKLSYHEGSNHKEFFVALDDNDLTSLMQTILRARKKAGALRLRLAKEQVSYLGVEEIINEG